jgi:hypothetical protein
MDPELRHMLGRHREQLLRRALALAVSRSTLDELVSRPIHERLDDLELLFEAAGGDDPGQRQPLDLQAELAHQLDRHRHSGEPFAVAVVASGTARIGRIEPGTDARRPVGPDARAWRQALCDCAAPGDIVIDAGDGATAIVLPDHDGREGLLVADRLCRAAWRSLGEQGPIAGLGVAGFPEDGSSPYEILAAAYDALWRRAEFDDAVPEPASLPVLVGDEEGEPAPVHPLRPR